MTKNSVFYDTPAVNLFDSIYTRENSRLHKLCMFDVIWAVIEDKHPSPSDSNIFLRSCCESSPLPRFSRLSIECLWTTHRWLTFNKLPLILLLLSMGFPELYIDTCGCFYWSFRSVLKKAVSVPHLHSQCQEAPSHWIKNHSFSLSWIPVSRLDKFDHPKKFNNYELKVL